MVTVTSHLNPEDNSVTIATRIKPLVEEHILRAVIAEVSSRIAEKYVEDHYQEVVAHIKPEAIATLVAAEAAADIGKTLKEDVRGRVERVVEKQIFQRGLLGGLKRIR